MKIFVYNQLHTDHGQNSLEMSFSCATVDSFEILYIILEPDTIQVFSNENFELNNFLFNKENTYEEKKEIIKNMEHDAVENKKFFDKLIQISSIQKIIIRNIFEQNNIIRNHVFNVIITY